MASDQKGARASGSGLSRTTAATGCSEPKAEAGSAPTEPAWLTTQSSDGYLWVKQDKFRESFCQDLPEDEALVMAVTQKAPLGSTFGDAVTAPAWKTKPSWYQVSTADRMIHPDNERRMAQRMGPHKIVELDAGHASLASQSSAVVDLIGEAAAATGS